MFYSYFIFLFTIQHFYVQYSICMYSIVFLCTVQYFFTIQYFYCSTVFVCMFSTVFLCTVQYNICVMQYSTSLYLTVIAVIIRNSGMTAAFYLLLSIKGYRFFIVKTDVLLKMFRAKNFRILDTRILLALMINLIFSLYPEKCIIFDQ